MAQINAENPRDPVVVECFRSMITQGVKLSTKAIVDAARDPDHPLHRYFEWNDSVAGEKYRRIQAWRLLAAQRAYVVAVNGVSREILADAKKLQVSVREFLPELDGTDTYRPREEAKADPANRARLVNAFVADLQSWCRRTADFPEVNIERSTILQLLSERESFVENKVAS